MPLAAGREGAGRALDAPRARRQGSERQGSPPRARRVRVACRAARARSSRRRSDHRPHRRRAPQGGARDAAAAGRPPLMRIGVAATAPLGADVLERLAEQHEVAWLLTRPDAPQGRGRRLGPPPAKLVAEQLGIPVHQPERPELPGELDRVVVCAYGLYIPSRLLEQSLWLNVHPSLLPRWRGAAPVERAILAGDEVTGVTIHETVAELDAGPVAAQEPFAVDALDAGQVFARSAEVAARLLGEVVESPSFEPQAEDGATYAEKIS